MKIRIGFVSNSSSCSFIVDDGKAAIKEFKKICKCNVHVPLSIDEDISFSLYGPKADLDKIAKRLELCKEPSLCFDGSYELYGMSFSTLLKLKLSWLKNISVGASAEVYDEANALFVRLLCKLLVNNNIKVKNTGDYGLSLDTNQSFLLNILNKVLDGEKRK